MRRFIALAVIALHGVLLLLCVSGQRLHLAKEPEGPYFISLWLPPDHSAKPVATEQPAQASKSVRPVRRDPVSLPSTPVTMTTPAAPSAEPAPVPQVDWAREATSAAQKESGRNPKAASEFSPAPKPVPAPCIPKKSSMEWNGKKDRRVGFSGGLPFIRLGKRCVVTIGFFACTPGELPEVNGHLLDDMRDPGRAASSVPDPNVCD